MKVLHIIARMNVGGTASYLFSLLEGLDEKGIDTLLAVGMVPENEKEDRRLNELKFVRVKSLSRAISPLRDLVSLRSINGLINEFQPDIIHSHTFKAGFLVRLKKRPMPIVHTFHGHHLYDPEFGRLSRIVINLVERFLAKRSRKLLTIGSAVGKELLKKGIGQPEQYESIPPGILPLVELNGELVREKLKISRSEFVIVWLGRFTGVKRPDLVVELAKLLPHLSFVMAGDGELRNGIELEAPKNLRILGIQKAAEMWSIADLALSTSDSEGMPLSLIEAQLCGVPVVATNVGSVSEIVEDGVTGLLTSVDAAEISNAISRLAGNESQLKEMGGSAHSRAREQFSQEIMVERHLKVYREITGKVSA